MENPLTDLEKQQLLSTLHLNKVYVPGLDRLMLRVAESIVGTKEQESAMLELSYYLTAYGNLVLAEEVARRRLNGYASASAFAAIASEIAKYDPVSSNRYLQDAETLLREIRDSDDQAILLQRISRGYSKLNNWQRATELADRISPPEDRVATLCEIAGSLWSTGDTGEAKRILAGAHAAAGKVEPGERTGALNDVAKVLVQMDRTTEAAQVWEEALPYARHSTEAPKWLVSICQALATLGCKERAREIASGIENDARRAQALAAIERVSG
jgi:hypothetical protein